MDKFSCKAQNTVTFPLIVQHFVFAISQEFPNVWRFLRCIKAQDAAFDPHVCSVHFYSRCLSYGASSRAHIAKVVLPLLIKCWRESGVSILFKVLWLMSYCSCVIFSATNWFTVKFSKIRNLRYYLPATNRLSDLVRMINLGHVDQAAGGGR